MLWLGSDICIAELPRTQGEQLEQGKLASLSGSSPPPDWQGAACDKRCHQNPPACCIAVCSWKGSGRQGNGRNNLSLWMSWLQGAPGAQSNIGCLVE